jgi:Na+:H+ antiporter, NhaA family
VGGMLLPALLFWAFNAGQITVSGWGIPMATDIAFALAVLHLLGNRVPTSLKVFVTALAIADDLGAVLVIALFYTDNLQLNYLAWAGGILAVLALLNTLRVRSLPIYLLLGLVLWYVTLKSGVHATVAGVLLAFTIPFRIRYTDDQLVEVVQDRLRIIRRDMSLGEVNPQQISEELETLSDRISSPAQRLENALHSPIAYVVIPIFAFCNTSLVIQPSLIDQLGSPLALGTMAGLVIGKPLGILGLSYGAVRLGWASLPTSVNWRQITGAACLAGIGFTMSIFISLLAFSNQPEAQAVAKLAILLASLIAGGIGFVILRSEPMRFVEENLPEK